MRKEFLVLRLIGALAENISKVGSKHWHCMYHRTLAIIFVYGKVRIVNYFLEKNMIWILDYNIFILFVQCRIDCPCTLLIIHILTMSWRWDNLRSAHDSLPMT